MIYLLLYLHFHRSEREAVAITTLTSISLILGSLTGYIVTGLENTGAGIYSLILTIAAILAVISTGRTR
ncbi:MAG: hypothetical protein ABWW65_02030 [Thermoprotei archaeon]